MIISIYRRAKLEPLSTVEHIFALTLDYLFHHRNATSIENLIRLSHWNTRGSKTDSTRLKRSFHLLLVSLCSDNA